MGGATPKVFAQLGQHSVLERTVRTIASCEAVEAIVVLTRTEDIPRVRDLLKAYDKVRVSAGGATRQESVSRGLAYIAELLPQRKLGAEDVYVIVHDAARCLLGREVLERTLESAYQYHAVSAGVRVVDSLKRVNADLRVQESVPRDGLWAVHTPQIFRMDLLLKAHEGASRDATDDASLVEKVHPVQMIESERSNIKITTPEDLHIAEAWLANREAQK